MEDPVKKRARRRKSYLANREKEIAAAAAWMAANPERVLASRKRRYWEDSEIQQRTKTRSILNKGVRAGRSARPDHCEECGSEGQPYKDGRAQIQAHHTDYSNPYAVTWLCRDCHREAHRELR